MRWSQWSHQAAGVAATMGIALGFLQVACAPTGAPAAVTLIDHTTLSILSGEVEVQAGLAPDVWLGAINGQTLTVGDHVRTLANAHALVTYFEGSTTTLSPNTEVVIQRLSQDEAGIQTDISIKVVAGKTWSRVVRLLDATSRFITETPSAVALVRGTEFEVSVSPTGASSFEMGSGEMAVAPLGAPALAVPVVAGETTTAVTGQPPQPPQPAPPPPSGLRITITSPATLYACDPSNRCTGWYAPAPGSPGIVVNQIPRSFYSGPDADPQELVLPEPASQYVMSLNPLGGGGAYHLDVAGLAGGNISTTQTFAGAIPRDARLETGLIVQVDATGRVQVGTIAEPVRAPDPPPGGALIARVQLTPLPPDPALIPTVQTAFARATQTRQARLQTLGNATETPAVRRWVPTPDLPRIQALTIEQARLTPRPQATPQPSPTLQPAALHVLQQAGVDLTQAAGALPGGSIAALVGARELSGVAPPVQTAVHSGKVATAIAQQVATAVGQATATSPTPTRTPAPAIPARAASPQSTGPRQQVLVTPTTTVTRVVASSTPPAPRPTVVRVTVVRIPLATARPSTLTRQPVITPTPASLRAAADASARTAGPSPVIRSPRATPTATPPTALARSRAIATRTATLRAVAAPLTATRTPTAASLARVTVSPTTQPAGADTSSLRQHATVTATADVRPAFAIPTSTYTPVPLRSVAMAEATSAPLGAAQRLATAAVTSTVQVTVVLPTLTPTPVPSPTVLPTATASPTIRPTATTMPPRLWQVAGREEIWLADLANGRKQWVADGALLQQAQLRDLALEHVAEDRLAQLPTGPALTVHPLVGHAETSAIYLRLADGVRRWIPDLASLQYHGLQQVAVENWSASRIRELVIGQPIPFATGGYPATVEPPSRVPPAATASLPSSTERGREALVPAVGSPRRRSDQPPAVAVSTATPMPRPPATAKPAASPTEQPTSPTNTPAPTSLVRPALA